MICMCYFNWPRTVEIIDFFYWFFPFYFLNSDISVTINVMKLKFSECDHKGPFEGSVLFYLGLSFYLIQKKGNFLYFFFTVNFYIW